MVSEYVRTVPHGVAFFLCVGSSEVSLCSGWDRRNTFEPEIIDRLEASTSTTFKYEHSSRGGRHKRAFNSHVNHL